MKTLTEHQHADSFASAFCNHFCNNHCKATAKNDTCFCTEAGIIAVEVLREIEAEAKILKFQR